MMRPMVLSQMKKKLFNGVILTTVVAFMLIFSVFAVKFSTVFYILICGAVGVFVYLLGRLRRKEGRE